MPSDERVYTGINAGAPREARHYGIDLLRLVSMLMIPVLHVLGQGGVMAKTASNHSTYYACWLLETACLCAGNCFGLISGFVGIRARFRVKKILRMIMTVEFYSLLLTLVLGLSHPEWINRDVLLKSVLPIQWKAWWYYSAYVALFFLMPFLNKGIQALTIKEKKQLLVLLFVVFSFSTTFSKPFGIDFLELIGGYSLIWLIVLYVFGACLREVMDTGSGGIPIPGRLWCLLGYLLCVLVGWGWKLLVEYHRIKEPAQTTFNRMFLTYTAPTIFGCAVFLLLLFYRIHIRAKGLCRFITVLTPSAFYVYILHTHPLVWEHILNERFTRWLSLPPASALIRSILAAAVIFILCMGLDLLRRCILDFMHKENRFGRLQKRN